MCMMLIKLWRQHTILLLIQLRQEIVCKTIQLLLDSLGSKSSHSPHRFYTIIQVLLNEKLTCAVYFMTVFTTWTCMYTYMKLEPQKRWAMLDLGRKQDMFSGMLFLETSCSAWSLCLVGSVLLAGCRIWMEQSLLHCHLLQGWLTAV